MTVPVVFEEGVWVALPVEEGLVSVRLISGDSATPFLLTVPAAAKLRDALAVVLGAVGTRS